MLEHVGTIFQEGLRQSPQSMPVSTSTLLVSAKLNRKSPRWGACLICPGKGASLLAMCPIIAHPKNNRNSKSYLNQFLKDPRKIEDLIGVPSKSRKNLCRIGIVQQCILKSYTSTYIDIENTYQVLSQACPVAGSPAALGSKPFANSLSHFVVLRRNQPQDLWQKTAL